MLLRIFSIFKGHVRSIYRAVPEISRILRFSIISGTQLGQGIVLPGVSVFDACESNSVEIGSLVCAALKILGYTGLPYEKHALFRCYSSSWVLLQCIYT
jgi:hypothetical protein